LGRRRRNVHKVIVIAAVIVAIVAAVSPGAPIIGAERQKLGG
tara:strand:- start:39 stop:164 length:126 start_codon:yes stop_codon:yes gene_type:complete